MSPPKSCAVCGDKALGCNFNAVTCESCKAFFRRNALAKKQFSCPFNQNCDINVVTRRFCQRCRLKKCLEIGMKSENIMSEEDKLIKRRKIEKNRAQRKLNNGQQHQDTSNGDCSVKQEKQQEQAAADSSGYDAFGTSLDSQSCNSYDSATGFGQPSSSAIASTAFLGEQDVKPELMTGEEMVEFIVSDADRASQAISKLMRTPAEAVASMEKIINSQKDALRLISHLIAYPGDALKIISKIMNSPFNALTVFTKFMSSPTDALEIISKIVSSPRDVLQFIKNLMDSPEDALDIMNKFMNTPAEALKIINKIFSSTNASASVSSASVSVCAENSNVNVKMQSVPLSPPPEAVAVEEQTLIQSMLNSSPSGSQLGLWTQESPSSYNTTSPQTLSSIASPLSVPTVPDIKSPLSYTDDLLSTSSSSSIAASLLNATTVTPPNLCNSVAATDQYEANNYDKNSDSYKPYAETPIPEDNVTESSLNSLDSVLTEIIRLEFQGYSSLSTVQSDVHVQQKEHSLQCGHATPTNCRNQDDFLLCSSEPVCAPSTVVLGRDLNDAEQMKLRELKLASEALYYPVDDDLSVLMGDDRIKTGDTHQDPKLLQVINLTAVAIKRLIKMAKKITAFRDMCQEDQVALLKGGCTEMMIMRSVMTYDDSQRLWKIPHVKEDMTNIRADVLKLAKGNVYEEHLKFIRTFDEKWRLDENIILIMCAIVLFTPRRPRVVHADVINLEQNSYYYLLRRYLESVYPGCEAKSAFMKLIQKISDVERLNRFCIGVYLNVNPAQVEPLLREIFDLKNH